MGGLTSPFTVAADGTGLVVTSWLQNAVQVWEPATDTVVENHEDFAVPLNAIRFQGDLVVAELATGLVVRLDAATGERTTLAQGLFVPAGLAASGDDLWVDDGASGVVCRSWRTARSWPPRRRWPAGWCSPKDWPWTATAACSSWSPGSGA